MCCCSSNDGDSKVVTEVLELPEAITIFKDPVQPEEETEEQRTPELVQEIETSAEEQEKPKADDSIFEVTLTINDGEKLGLSCDFTDGKTFVISLARPGGAAVKWNAQNPDQALSEGCRIIMVNSVDGDAKLMLAEMHKVGPMTLLVKRADAVTEAASKALAVQLQLSTADDGLFVAMLMLSEDVKLGLSCDFSDGKTFLISVTRPGGAADEWNSHNPEKALSPGCRILEVNTVKDDAKEMLVELQKVGAVQLLVRQA